MKQTWSVMLLSKFWSVSNILSFALSMSWSISPNSFSVKIFASITSPGTSSFFILQPVPHICLQDHFHYFLPAVQIGFWTSVVSTVPWSALSSISSIYIDSNFTSILTIFCCFAECSFFLANSLFLVIHF